MTVQYQNYVNGQFISSDGALIDVRNPANGELLAQIPSTDAAGVDLAVAAAQRAQPAWEKLPAIERARYLRAIATIGLST